MSAAKHTLEPMPLAGWIGGFDFDHKPHGTLEVVVDEPFRTALGKNARVLLVPDELVYRAAPMLADALEALLAANPFIRGADDAIKALRAAGRLP